MRILAIAVLTGLIMASAPAANAQEQVPETAAAIFAGGCFWCMEPPFDKLDGVHATVSGYIGGSAKDADYGRVSSGGTGHYEAVRIEYDPAKIDFATLLEVFWRNVDPFDGRGQFCDKGPQYLTAIFALDETQRKLAEESKAALAARTSEHGEIRTEILPASEFYPAEAYHQDYYQKNPVRYKFYRWNCGRDQRLQAIWGKS